MGLSVLIIAKNESKHIVECIKSVSFADEIIVIDDNSSDDTAKKAQAEGAHVYLRAMNGDFGAQQNYAIEQANHHWLLFIDCDERVTEDLANEIQQVVSKNENCAYEIRRINHFNRKAIRHGTMRPDWTVRLAPKDQCVVVGVVHQVITSPYAIKKLTQDMLHYTYDSWEQIVNKTNQYAQLSAEKYLLAGKKVNFFTDIIIRPVWAFIKMYIIHLGFLDGKIGYILAQNHYFYTLNKYIYFYFKKNLSDS